MNYSRGFFGSFLVDLANKNARTLRPSSMFLDHMIMTGITFIPSMVIMFMGINTNYNIHNLPFTTVLFIYMNKDVVGGKSIGKRLQGYKVVKRGTTEIASSLRCYLRNIVIPLLWPMEVLITYFNPTRRLGDLIAGTEVIMAEKESITSIFKDLKAFKINIQIVWVLMAGFIFSYLFNYLT